MTLPTFSSSTTADEVVLALSKEIGGKNILITGTSIGGIGFETARAIAKHANLVVITGHNSERLKLSEEAIKMDVPTANIRTLLLDLSSLVAVRKSATEVNTYSEPLHVLIHNAAAIPDAFQLTPDDIEIQMATDHFGPFLLTKLLISKLLESTTPAFTPRVVFVASMVHAMGPGIDFNHLRRPDAAVEDNLLLRYGEAKSANILTASELSRRARGKLHAYSLHPGAIFTQGTQKMSPSLKADGKPNLELAQWKTMAQGAATTVVAAFDPRFSDKSGAYLVDCVEANKDVAPHSSDLGNADKLWSMTEDIIGEKFTF